MHGAQGLQAVLLFFGYLLNEKHLTPYLQTLLVSQKISAFIQQAYVSGAILGVGNTSQ